MNHRFLIPFIMVILFSGWSRAEGAPPAPEWQWYELNAEKKVQINLYMFVAAGCPHCKKAIEFTDGLSAKYSWLTIRRYEVTGTPGNLAFYRRMAESLKVNAGTTPAMFYCNTATIGFESAEKTGAKIEKELLRWYEALQKHFKDRSSLDRNIAIALLATAIMPPERESLPESVSPMNPIELPSPEELGLTPLPPEPETVSVPYYGEVSPDELSLPALTAILAGCDAFNPCAFFVLLTLLSVMVHSHSRGRMLFVGAVFVFFSGMMYFLFMAAWLNLFFLIGELRVITLLAGFAALTAALLNIKDFWIFHVGPSLSIPDSAKPSLFRRMGRLVEAGSFPALVIGTAGLAFAANLYELLCTAGFPMVYTRVLTLRELSPAEYYGYLLAYNVIYVLPLAAIVTIFAFTLGSRKLTEHQGRILKLFSGMMLLGLGGSLLIQPELLRSASGAVGVLVAALGGTVLMLLVETILRNRS